MRAPQAQGSDAIECISHSLQVAGGTISTQELHQAHNRGHQFQRFSTQTPDGRVCNRFGLGQQGKGMVEISDRSANTAFVTAASVRQGAR
ncbi:MAG: hypothetical protein MUC44_14040, partial [Beijerinckiaceae bacterium]|nr:hypothetical protein [Beijerinckiaceae bacterium]